MTAGTATSDVECAEPYHRFGSNAADGAAAVAVDGAGNVYVAGTTSGPLAGSTAGAADAFVRKFDPKGTILWTKQFGTMADDQASAIAVDGTGNLYVAGTTYGSLEGTSFGSSDGFVRKLDASGATLWTRQFGTTGPESGKALVVDGSGNVYVAGTTYPTGGQSSGDPFVRKLDASGTPLWVHQSGGTDEDEANAVAVDGSGNVYIGGYTYGLTAGSNQGGRDAWVRKLNASGVVQWTRQFGSADSDELAGAAVDALGNVYVVGTSGGDLAGTILGASDAFVRKYDTGGTALWTRPVGTTDFEYGIAVAVDGNNNAYVVGSTSGVFTDANAGMNTGLNDIYVRKLDPSGATLWTKQVGTPADDSAQAATADAAGNVYVVGYKDFTAQGDAFVLHVPAQSP
jgi:hypothetical protein